MGPNDANIVGNVHGGIILKMIEEAGCIVSTRHCNTQNGVRTVFLLDLQPLGAVVVVATTQKKGRDFFLLFFFFWWWLQHFFPQLCAFYKGALICAGLANFHPYYPNNDNLKTDYKKIVFISRKWTKLKFTTLIKFSNLAPSLINNEGAFCCSGLLHSDLFSSMLVFTFHLVNFHRLPTLITCIIWLSSYLLQQYVHYCVLHCTFQIRHPDRHMIH